MGKLLNFFVSHFPYPLNKVKEDLHHETVIVLRIIQVNTCKVLRVVPSYSKHNGHACCINTNAVCHQH